MDKRIVDELLSNEKLMSHFKEQSYWMKALNRHPATIKDFKREMKILYHERASDKVSTAIDSVEMISSVLESLQ